MEFRNSAFFLVPYLIESLSVFRNRRFQPKKGLLSLAYFIANQDALLETLANL